MAKPKKKTNIREQIVKIDEEQIVKTHEAIERWHSHTHPQYRTLDSLQSYLIRNRKLVLSDLAPEELKNDQEDINFWRKFSYRYLASYLYTKKLDFRLTPLAVDAILNPAPIDDLEHYGYDFFLDHFYEHPLLEEKIMASINTPAKLRIVPVFPADTDFMAWLFDPSDMKTYVFRVNNGEENVGLKKEGRRIKSTGHYSIFEEYQRKNNPCPSFYPNPFSKLYREKLKKYREIEALPTKSGKKYNKLVKEFSSLVRTGKMKKYL